MQRESDLGSLDWRMRVRKEFCRGLDENSGNVKKLSPDGVSFGNSLTAPATIMDFGFNQEQELLRDSARTFLATECPMTLVRQLMEEEQGYAPELWQKMASLGWTGMLIPEEDGGLGLSFVEMALLLEEMGRVTLPGPFFSTAVCAASLLSEPDTGPAARSLLPGIASGETRATIAWMESSGQLDPEAIQASWRPVADGIELEGVKVFVPDAIGADWILVAARAAETEGPDGIDLFLVPAGADGLSLTPLQTLDQTRKQAEVRLAGVRVGASDRIGPAGSGWPRLERMAERARAALAAESCGGAARVLEMSVDYAKVREQFGKPIGSFQAIQHKCADMMVKVESGRSAAWYAAWAIASGAPEAHLASAMAKAYCSDAFREVAGEGIQIHGGIGFTWEHDMHIYFKRAKSSEVAFGDGVWNRERVARVILPEAGSGDFDE